MRCRQSLVLNLEEYNPEIEYSLSRIRDRKCESKKMMAKEQTPPKQLEESFTPTTYDSPASTRMPVALRPFEINHSLIQMVPPFYGLVFENSFKHGDVFLEICSTVFLNNVSSDALHLHLFSFSLKDKAKAWLDAKTNITNCDQISPIGINAKGILE